MFKCHIPSFVSDHVQVVSWHDSEDGEYLTNENYGIIAVTVFAMLPGNPFLFSTVPDSNVFVEPKTESRAFMIVIFSVVSQAYTVHLVEENVLRGNAAILKCLIPSFVTEYVSVASWIISEGDDETEIQLNDTANHDGISILS